MDYLREHPELHEKFCDGDRATTGKVYDEYSPDIVKVLSGGFTVISTGMRVPPLRNPDDVADLLNQTFALAFDAPARRRYDGKRDYGRYLRAIARNARVTQYRKHHRELPSSGRDSYEDADVIAGEPTEPERSRIEPKVKELLDRYLANAPERIRALHLLRHEEDLSEQETADRLGISRTRVIQLEDRMLKELHQLLERAGVHASADRLTPSPGEPSNG